MGKDEYKNAENYLNKKIGRKGGKKNKSAVKENIKED